MSDISEQTVADLKNRDDQVKPSCQGATQFTTLSRSLDHDCVAFRRFCLGLVEYGRMIIV